MSVVMMMFRWLLLLWIGAAWCDYYEDTIADEIGRSVDYVKDAAEFKSYNRRPREFGTFDFVVIGAGSSGSVVANRLSENRNWTVLLLEAGREENNSSQIPALYDYAEYNWGFHSTRQETCCLEMVGVCPFSRGKLLGGTTAITALMYVRGNKFDFDQWGRNNPGWNYNDVLPFFLKSENSAIQGDEGYHGFDGYLSVHRLYGDSHKVPVFLRANEELGNPIVDINGINQLGATRTQFNTIYDLRQGMVRAFLEPAHSRSNLKISTNSFVTKIIIDNTTKAATGVIFFHNKIQYVVRIKKEIILSAGVVRSPTILMHSGIGPKRHLQQLKIPIVKDLDVGQHMHNHPIFYYIPFTTSINDSTYLEQYYIYLSRNKGNRLGTAVNAQSIAFFQLSTKNDTQPDIEVVFMPTVAEPFEWMTGSPRSVWSEISQIMVVLLHPKARGQILLKSNDPFQYPLVDTKCLADKENKDIETLYKGIEKVMELLVTDAFQSIDATLLPDRRCVDRGFGSREYWECSIRLSSFNAYDGGGTCSMGRVVNHRLKVHGIRNLRVADASVIPVTLSGHMSAPAMMVGERVADFIKNRYS